MNKIIYSWDELKNLKELDFYLDEGLMVNGVFLFGVEKIIVTVDEHYFVSIQFMRNEEKFAAIFVTKKMILEVHNKNIIGIKKPYSF